MFKIGQKVVCVDASTAHGHPPGSELKERRTYTVRAVGLTVADTPGLRLYEVVLSSEPGAIGSISGRPFADAFYRASRFRPLVENKSEISFTAGADPSSEKWDNRKRTKVRA